MQFKKNIKKLLLISIISIMSFNVLADPEKNIYLDKTSNKMMDPNEKFSYVNGKIELNNDSQTKTVQRNSSLKIKSAVYQNASYATSNNNISNRSIRQMNMNPTRPNDIYFVSGQRACFEEAAAYHHVDPWLLMSIAYVESGFKNDVRNANKNGSYDTGLMQINSIWIPTLRKKGIDPSALKNTCASAYIGAWILSANIKRYGYNWRAIGAYNSANPRIGLIYAKKVYAAHAKFTGIKN